ncbi:DUF2075 domain-containing protein [Exiguobacterium chiriqhucha]|uniref:DUF2075 domain-containing protein n=1 Tax=Exiguobacterium chiriqhucha TaxID=1385984 RepID=UPI0004975603|nr:DUF2075 domain-containing protein [Exiguobacterium chiriqhucha]
MIIYNEPKYIFVEHILEKEISYILSKNIEEKMNRRVSASEMTSWENSLSEMMRVIRGESIPDDVNILLEFNLPSTQKRIDFIIAGKDEDGQKNAIIVELKQWTKAELADGDGIVQTAFRGRTQSTVHPSYQALSYRRYLENYLESVDPTESDITLDSCAYLHNYIRSRKNEAEPLLNDRYSHYYKEAPIYFKMDDLRLADYVTKRVGAGKGAEIAREIETGKLRPSKKLVETLNLMFEGNEEFILLDEQKVAYEQILTIYTEHVLHTDEKHVVLIKGGPGTGKSVIGLNALKALVNEQALVEYITPNAAFREVLRKKLVRQKSMIEIRDMFKGSGSYVDTQANKIDVLVCDEAHRLKNHGHMQRKIAGENQATQIIRSAKMSVFFIDDEQMISKKDVGSYTLIKEEAKRQDAIIHELTLDSQFRCGGSGNYIQWLSELFNNEATTELDGSYDIRVLDSPQQLMDEVVSKRDGRVTAGYAWSWTKERIDGQLVPDVQIPEHDFAMAWNDAKRLDWAIHPDGREQIGCIHTVQGLEMTYAGVIIGPDLGYDPQSRQLIVRREEFKDSGARPAKPKKNEVDALEKLVKNTYRTLMTRGMKGCYVYCCDPELQKYMKQRIDSTSHEYKSVTRGI